MEYSFDELSQAARAVLNPRRLSEHAEAGGVGNVQVTGKLSMAARKDSSATPRRKQHFANINMLKEMGFAIQWLGYANTI